MTQRQILKFAYDGALMIWAKENEYLTANPGSSLSKAREAKAWEDLQAVRALLIAEEAKDSLTA